MVYEVGRTQFLSEFHDELVDYDPIKAAAHMVKSMKLVGADDETIDELGKLVKITNEEREMAKKQLPSAKMGEKAALKAKTPKKEKVAKGEKGERAPRNSSANRFKELIMIGKYTDDEIFEKVQSEFGLASDKRKYVAWYRNWLKNNGKNPPDKKVA
jgi:hypothetical protein